MVSFLRLFIFVVVGVNSQLLMAHEVRPAVADIEFYPGGEVHLSIEVNLEALIAGIEPRYSNTDDSPDAQKYKQLRALAPQQLASAYNSYVAQYLQGLNLLAGETPVEWVPDEVETIEQADLRLSRLSRLGFKGVLPPNEQSVTFSYAKNFGNIAVKFRKAGEQATTVDWLTQGALSPVFTLDKDVLPRSRWQTAQTYVSLGFVHIVPRGIDHILFVLGLFLLSLRIGPLLAQVTAFTLAHSITLGLSIYGVISLSPVIVEPLIALSIAYVGIENIVRGHNSPSRIAVIFLFGLLHGLGFSSVLTEIGLPRSEFLTALLSFNVGVEFGQLAVILLATSVVYLSGLARHPRYRQWVTVPGSALITVVGLYWFIERTVGFPWV